MIEDALRYQTQGDDWIKRVLLGGGVLFLSIFIVPIFTFNGYMVEVMRRVLGGDTASPPEWGELDLVDTTIYGLKHAVVVLAYGLVVALVAGIPLIVLTGLGNALDVGLITGLGLLVGGLAYFVGSLALLAILPVATANFVMEDSIVAGFDLETLRAVVPNRTMLMAVLYAFVVNILVSIVTSILGATIIGYLAVPFVVFIGQSAIFYVWARGFGDAYEELHGERPTVPDGPTKATPAAAGSTETTTTTADTGGTPDDIANSGVDQSSDEERWE